MQCCTGPCQNMTPRCCTLALSDTSLRNLMLSSLTPGANCFFFFLCSSYCAEVLTTTCGRNRRTPRCDNHLNPDFAFVLRKTPLQLRIWSCLNGIDQSLKKTTWFSTDFHCESTLHLQQGFNGKHFEVDSLSLNSMTSLILFAAAAAQDSRDTEVTRTKTKPQQCFHTLD